MGRSHSAKTTKVLSLSNLAIHQKGFICPDRKAIITKESVIIY